MNIEAGVFPGEELVGQFPADLLFPEQHLKDLVAEEVFKFLYVYFRKDVKPPVRHEAAVGDKAIEVGMEVVTATDLPNALAQQIPKRRGSRGGL